MSILTNVNVAASKPGEALASWEGSDAALASFAFVDGIPVAAAMITSSTSRSKIAQWDDGATRHVEVHETAVNEPAQATVPPPNRRPQVSWTPLSGAAKYRVYVNDVLERTVGHDDDTVRYSIPCPIWLDAGWNEIRVEAVDAHGNESTRANWWYFVWTPLDAPSAVAVSGTGPYTITITA